MDFCIDLEYFSPSFMLDQFHFTIFINGTVVQSAQIIANIAATFLIYKVPRKVYGYVSFAVIVICSTVLIFIWDQSKEEEGSELGPNTAILGLVFVIMYSITA